MKKFNLLLVAAALLIDWRFWYRWHTLPEDAGEWPASYYQPTATLTGAPAPFFPVAGASQRSIDPAALEAAASWAEAHNSAALLVLHRGVDRLLRGVPGVQALATRPDLVAELEALRALVWKTVEQYVGGADMSELASMCKLKATRLMRETYDDCLQFWGGMGFVEETAVARRFRDSRLGSIGGGADEVMLSIIAKHMGTLPERPG